MSHTRRSRRCTIVAATAFLAACQRGEERTLAAAIGKPAAAPVVPAPAAMMPASQPEPGRFVPRDATDSTFVEGLPARLTRLLYQRWKPDTAVTYAECGEPAGDGYQIAAERAVARIRLISLRETDPDTAFHGPDTLWRHLMARLEVLRIASRERDPQTSDTVTPMVVGLRIDTLGIDFHRRDGAWHRCGPEWSVAPMPVSIALIGPDGEDDRATIPLRRIPPDASWARVRAIADSVSHASIELDVSVLEPRDPARRGDGVRRLSPDSFPDLPPSTRRDLAQRGCTIPQEGGHPLPRQNVIHGAFLAAGMNETAVLCSVRDTSRILVYRRGVDAAVDSLETDADSHRLQGGGGSAAMEYSRVLQTLPRAEVQRWRTDMDNHPIPRPVDHDAINELFSGKSAVAYYHARGRWYKQVTED